MGCQGSKEGAEKSGSAHKPKAAVSQNSASQLLSGPPGEVTPEVKDLVRESWAMFIAKNAEIAPRTHTVLLFVKLFELAPKAKELFKFLDDVTMENLEESEALHTHAMRVTEAISAVVGMMDDMAAVQKAVTSLGERHFVYGVVEDYVDPVIKGLNYALETTLGEVLTPKHKAAWKLVLDKVGELMIAGLREKKKKVANSMESASEIV